MQPRQLDHNTPLTPVQAELSCPDLALDPSHFESTDPPDILGYTELAEAREIPVSAKAAGPPFGTVSLDQPEQVRVVETAEGSSHIELWSQGWIVDGWIPAELVGERDRAVGGVVGGVIGGSSRSPHPDTVVCREPLYVGVYDGHTVTALGTLDAGPPVRALDNKGPWTEVQLPGVHWLEMQPPRSLVVPKADLQSCQ